ncbi:T9SS type B sorting domain-containing protein [Polaribacter vadi]|uniref:T9SS type B sorting domain-containing protein n=1 Tax=Polaribacter TaxID=52959 RepID=UPI001C08E3AC|nr:MULTISPECIES: T9SS type B sorting domain-containing protein [Polaribacter]MBU3010173.1 T9SS type B sorting domain-containing protein [Polaribacter vadi]MDO6739980.1 T9SS type B sorting domain-containing protein [Polaribacter sp. 1_MG-2023]
MKRLLPLFIFCFLFYLNINSQITLTHNVGNTPIKTDWESCDDEESWARTFTLSEFGISETDQFIITSGQTAISNSYNGARISIGVFSIDDNFPNSNTTYLGGGSVTTPEIGSTPEIITINFNRAIVIPSKATNILVTISQSDDIYNSNYKKVLIAGTNQDSDVSWFSGCRKYSWTTTDKLDSPKPNANFFINVTGEKRSLINTKSNLTLSSNVSDEVFETGIYGCSWGGVSWSKTFNLSDFGITENEEYIINSGQIGIVESNEWDTNIEFNIYEIDDDFPDSFSETKLIGKSQSLSKFGSPQNAHISIIYFDNPIIIDASVKKILVEVKQLSSLSSAAVAFAAGTKVDNGISWFKSYNGGCPPYNEFKKTSDLGIPDANFFITVNGEAKTILPFEITNDNTCSNLTNNLSLTNQSEIKSVVWNFDDPSSGANNTSTDIDVNHQFSSPGIYNVTAEVVHLDNTSYTIPKEIEIFEAPNINTPVSLKQCDNSDINGFSFFNLNEVKEEIITNSDDYTITFYEEKIDAENNGVSITDVTTYKNEIVSVDKVWARVENSNGCYRVSEVNLFVSTTQIPATLLNSFYQCDDGTNTTDGIATFNFSSVTSDIENIFPTGQLLIINYYRNEDDALAEENAITDITNYQNIGYPNQQNIYIRVDSKFDNDCLGLGAHISLNVENIPIANSVTINPECDNDRDGFYSFDTSTIQNTIIGSQTDVTVTYFDENGSQLSSPLPNPFITKTQNITVKIENTYSKDLDGKCYDETTINFIVNTVPIANPILPQEECDDDFDGIIGFDTSNIESTIIGTQTNLIVKYFDENNNALPSPLPNPFYTSSQTIKVRLENPTYDICFEETTIDFIVREKPTVNLISDDIICITNNSQLEITVENPNSDYSYTWRDENNNIVGNSFSTTVYKGGTFNVIATSIYGCDSDKEEILIKESSVSKITINDIEVQDDSENNFIKINTSNLGLGDYEFRLLDDNLNVLFNYQSDPNFENLEGGNYILEVNDLNNCGSVPFEISLISFPDYFTPNADGNNDYWQIKGINKSYYKEGTISIFNRYGKQITTFTINDLGWDGTYNGNILSSNNYWFRAILVNQQDQIKSRTGNFSLIRK